MRQGWQGGLVTRRAAELLAVAACATVADPARPVEAVPARFAATVTVPAVASAEHLAATVGALVALDPATQDYGLTFVAATDPLTTRLRTLTSAALAAFLVAPGDGPGRWVFVTPDHHRWLVTRPWSMDTAFVGCTAATARAMADADPRVAVTDPARHGRGTAGPLGRPLRRSEVDLGAAG